MEKKNVFEIYHNVANIIEDAYAQWPVLHEDEEYKTYVNNIVNDIVNAEIIEEFFALTYYVLTIRNEYEKCSVGYKIFNSIFDVIYESL